MMLEEEPASAVKGADAKGRRRTSFVGWTAFGFKKMGGFDLV